MRHTKRVVHHSFATGQRTLWNTPLFYGSFCAFSSCLRHTNLSIEQNPMLNPGFDPSQLVVTYFFSTDFAVGCRCRCQSPFCSSAKSHGFFFPIPSLSLFFITHQLLLPTPSRVLTLFLLTTNNYPTMPVSQSHLAHPQGNNLTPSRKSALWNVSHPVPSTTTRLSSARSKQEKLLLKRPSACQARMALAGQQEADIRQETMLSVLVDVGNTMDDGPLFNVEIVREFRS